MQHDLFANPNRRERLGFPLIVELQANIAEGAFRVVAPLTAVTAGTPINRLVPIIEHNGEHFAVLFNLITNLSSRLLRHPVGSIAQYRDDLSRALDWLFFGILIRMAETTGRLDRGNGTELAWVRVDGRGPTVVFLPGFRSDMTGDKATALAAFCADTWPQDVAV